MFRLNDLTKKGEICFYVSKSIKTFIIVFCTQCFSIEDKKRKQEEIYIAPWEIYDEIGQGKGFILNFTFSAFIIVFSLKE